MEVLITFSCCWTWQRRRRRRRSTTRDGSETSRRTRVISCNWHVRFGTVPPLYQNSYWTQFFTSHRFPVDSENKTSSFRYPNPELKIKMIRARQSRVITLLLWARHSWKTTYLSQGAEPSVWTDSRAANVLSQLDKETFKVNYKGNWDKTCALHQDDVHHTSKRSGVIGGTGGHAHFGERKCVSFHRIGAAGNAWSLVQSIFDTTLVAAVVSVNIVLHRRPAERQQF